MMRGATVVSNWAACIDRARATTSPRSSTATYTFHVRAIDAAGNTGTDATRSYTLDRTAPAAPVITGGPPAEHGRRARPSFSFTARGRRDARPAA